MNFKKLIILIVLLLFISGCAKIQSLTKFDWSGKKEFVSGRGLTPEFLVEMPPLDRIYEEQEFQVGVKVTNYGLSDVVGGEICVSDGLSSHYIGIPTGGDGACKELVIDSAEKSTIEKKIVPTVKKFFFPGVDDHYYYQGLVSDITTRIKSEIIYEYKTIFNSQICISKKEDDPCNFRNVKIDDSVRFSPITITSIKKDVLPTPTESKEVKFILEIYIKNIGGGKIYDESAKDESVSKKQGFTMEIKSAGSSADCRPKKEDKYFLEDSGGVIVTCDMTSSFEGEYIDNPLEIELSYSYKISQQTNEIIIKDKKEETEIIT